MEFSFSSIELVFLQIVDWSISVTIEAREIFLEGTLLYFFLLGTF